MCNNRFPVPEETKKDQVVFRKYFRKHFKAIWEIQKLSNSFPGVFSGEFLQNVNRSRNLIFLEFYLTQFQIVFSLCIIPNFMKVEPTVFSVLRHFQMSNNHSDLLLLTRRLSLTRSFPHLKFLWIYFVFLIKLF